MKSWKTKSGNRILQVLSGRSNVFLLTNGAKNILIDTGPKFMGKTLEKRLTRLNVHQIDYLILTHSHFDHAGNARSIKEKFNARVIIHKDEASYLASGDFLIPQGTNFVTRTLVNLLSKHVAHKFKCEPCSNDLLTETKNNFKDDGFNAYIMHTPGHSSGSVSVIVDDEIALVGDAMFGVFKWSVFPPFAQEPDQMIQSWGRLLETKCSVFLPSHGTANSRQLVQKDYDKRIKK
ncbi:MAG TPA: MBL fold metallo-hydrolase [Bacteroidales bacterium]|nr:MBL fold metallo-hydrolase [Bacteroidales bacterium]